MVKPAEQPTEKIYVTPSTKLAIASIKEAGERYGDVVARLIKRERENDFVAHLERVAKEGDFVDMESDDEYTTIRDEVVKSAPQDRKTGAGIRKRAVR